MSVRTFVAAAACTLAAACFSPVFEKQCDTDEDCGNGWVCELNRCVPPQAVGGGTGGGGTGGGTGGGGTGGGIGGGGGGGAVGGGAGGGAGGGTGGGGGCPGCMDLSGQCQPGIGQFACGTGGVVCEVCQTGSPCVNGKCQPPPCNAMTCQGCCENGFCQPGLSAGACGLNGEVCVRCSAGALCENGRCQPCGPASCPTGCCLNGACMPGTSQMVCGTGGSACVSCASGATCRGGFCTPSPIDGGPIVIDGGFPGVPVGSACTNDMNCQPPFTQRCQSGLTSDGSPTGYPGGYCTATCGTNLPCADGVCITETVGAVTTSQCKQWCLGPGSGQSSCRAGYVCAPGGSLPGIAGWCRPRCNTGPLAACPPGVTCNSGSGYCM